MTLSLVYNRKVVRQSEQLIISWVVELENLPKILSRYNPLLLHKFETFFFQMYAKYGSLSTANSLAKCVRRFGKIKQNRAKVKSRVCFCFVLLFFLFGFVCFYFLLLFCFLSCFWHS